MAESTQEEVPAGSTWRSLLSSSHLQCATNDEMMIPFKSVIEVEGPYIVGTYNKYMAGVDLLFAAKYKLNIKFHRCYIYTIILAAMNARLLYKQNCKALKMTRERDAEQETVSGTTCFLSSSSSSWRTQHPKRWRPSSGRRNTFTQTVTSMWVPQPRGLRPPPTGCTQRHDCTFPSGDKERTLQ